MNNIEKLDRCYSEILIDNLVEDLRCFMCNNYLMFGPLRETSDGNVICSSCVAPTSDARRAFFLEKLINRVSFPCGNRKHGCSKSVTFDTAEDHRSVCKYECIPCPYHKTQSCVWEGAFDKINGHIIQNHKKLTKKDLCFLIDVNCDKNEEFVALYEKNLYFVQYRWVSSLLTYSISQFNETTKEPHSKIQIFDNISKDCVTINGKLCKYYRTNWNSDNSHNIDIKPLIGTLFNSEILLCNVIIEWSEIKCKWDGCEMITNAKIIKNHKESCDWRLYKCFLSHCDDSFRKSSDKEHFRKHNILYVDGNLELSFKFQNVLYKYYTFIYDQFVCVYYIKGASGLHILLKSATDQKPNLQYVIKPLRKEQTSGVKHLRRETPMTVYTKYTTWNEVITISNDDSVLRYNNLVLEIKRS